MKRVTPCYLGSVLPLCHFCRHLLEDGPWQCSAYPEGIPQEILWMNVDHRMPYLDDQGIRFTLREDLAEYWYTRFLSEYFEDTRVRDEEANRKERERYAEMIQGILERRRVPLPTVK